MTSTQHDTINEAIERLQQRGKSCWKEPSPYISSKEEWVEIKIKVAELEKLKQKS